MTRDEWVGQIRFRLDRLAAENAHHEFEKLCMMFARRRIASNIVPATGPVSAGGDQGRDFETFRTFVVRNAAGTGFSRSVSEQTIAFACTTERGNLAAKIKGDIRKIMCPPEDRAGPSAEVVYVFASSDVPVGLRHRLQAWARRDHGIELHVIDGTMLAVHLAADDLLVEAAEHLRLPRELIPPSSLPSIMAATHEKLGAIAEDFDFLATLSSEQSGLWLRPKREKLGTVELDWNPIFDFPDTPAGREAELAFEEHGRTGAPVRIAGEFVRDLGIPESLKSAFGLEKADVAAVELGPRGAGSIFPCDAVLECSGGGDARIPSVELTVFHAGSDQITLADLHNEAALRFQIVIDWAAQTFSIAAAPNPGVNVKRQLEGARFQRAMAQGGILKFIHIATGMPLVGGSLTSGALPAPDSSVEPFLEKLFEIQQRSGVLLSAPPEFTAAQARKVFELAQIVAGGVRIAVVNLTLPFGAEQVKMLLDLLAREPEQPLHLAGTISRRASMFGTEIELGRGIISAEKIYIAPDEITRLERAIESGAPGDIYKVMVRVPEDCGALLRYERWLSDLERSAFFSHHDLQADAQSHPC